MIRPYLQEPIPASLEHFPVVLVTGARQVGKSTLAHCLIESEWKAGYLTLDDRATLDAALRDPDVISADLQLPSSSTKFKRRPISCLRGRTKENSWNSN